MEGTIWNHFSENNYRKGIQAALSASAQFGQQRVQTCLHLLTDIDSTLVPESHMVRREMVCFTSFTKHADKTHTKALKPHMKLSSVRGSMDPHSDGLGENG